MKCEIVRDTLRAEYYVFVKLIELIQFQAAMEATDRQAETGSKYAVGDTPRTKLRHCNIKVGNLCNT